MQLPALAEAERQRYARHLSLAEVGPEGQAIFGTVLQAIPVMVVYIVVAFGADHVLQKIGTGIFSRACGGLQDNRTVDFIGAHHDGAHLFQIVDVKRRNAVRVFRRVIEQLPKTDKCHVEYPFCNEC